MWRGCNRNRPRRTENVLQSCQELTFQFRSQRVLTRFDAFTDTRVVRIVNRLVVTVVKVPIAVVGIIVIVTYGVEIIGAIRIPRPRPVAAILLNRTVKKRLAYDLSRQ